MRNPYAIALDLCERTLTLALRASGKIVVRKISEDEFNDEVVSFWRQDYERAYKKFNERLTPSEIKLHSVSKLFKTQFPDDQNKKNFLTTANLVRQYRNVLIHSVSPIRIRIRDIVFIPKPKYLSGYTHGRWSSERSKLDGNHFAAAMEIIGNLADELVECTNNLWPILLAEMETEKITSLYRSMPQNTTSSVPKSPIGENIPPGSLVGQFPPEGFSRHDPIPDNDSKGSASVELPRHDSIGASSYIIPTEGDPLG
jgi:hypothetical protein